MDDHENNMSHLSNQPVGGHRSKNSKVLNIDDMPIPTTKGKTFEELLESNLQQMNEDPYQQIDNDPYNLNHRNAA
jgi:hypothetical protein